MGASGSARLMAQVRLIDVLPDFAPRNHMAANSERLPHATQRAGEASRPDVGELLRQEGERAQAAAEARLSARHEAQMAELREEMDRALSEQARHLGEDAGQTIALRLSEMQAQVSAHLSSAVARIVGGVLSEELQRRSVAILATAIGAALADSDAVTIGVRGPQSLFAALTEALGARAVGIDYVEDGGFDLTVTIDGAVLETRLGEWSAALSEILA